MTPRPYQLASLDGGDHRGLGAFACWQDHTSTLVNLPTGMGKSTVAAMCAMRVTGRVLFVVHLREIVRQVHDSFQKITGEHIGMEMASSRSSTIMPERIIVASIQTMNARLNRFDPNEFDLVIGDEIHHGVSKSWKNVFDYFKQNPNCKILGLSATPERADKIKLGSVIESVAYTYPLQEACNDGWIVKPRQLSIVIPGLDFSAIPRKKGDYSLEELDAILQTYAVESAHRSLEAIYGLYPHELDAVPESEWNAYIGDREPQRTLAFCVTVKHAQKVANALNSIREGLCGYISGETPHIERRNIFRDFKNGSLPVLANCGVTVEGYDNPNILNILMMRPTMSKSLFIQMLGRASRTIEGTLTPEMETAEARLEAIVNSAKPFSTIIDFTGNSRDHRLITVCDIFGESQEKPVREELERRAKEKPIEVEKEIEVILRERYKLKQTEFHEIEINGFTGKRKKKGKKLSKEEKAERAAKQAQRGLTAKEFDWLSNQKLHPERRTLEENKQLLKNMKHRKLAGLCSYRQGFTLQKYGYTKNEIERMPFREASAIITRIAENGWKPVPRALPSYTDRLMHETESDYYGNGEAAF